MKSSSRRKGTVEDGGGFGWRAWRTVTGAETGQKLAVIEDVPILIIHSVVGG